MDIEYLVKSIYELCLIAQAKIELYVDQYGDTKTTRDIETDLAGITDQCESIRKALADRAVG